MRIIEIDGKKYMKIAEAKDIFDLSARHLRKKCAAGKIAGAIYDKLEKSWLIPIIPQKKL